MKNPLRYVGGKYYLKKWIISEFPQNKNWKVYVEPFGGAGHVIFEKDRSKDELEVYNDINQNMINLFKVLQDEIKFNKLIKYLELTPYSREYFYELRDGKYNIPEQDEDLCSAYKYLVLMKQSFSSNYLNRKPSWSYNVSDNKTNNTKTFSSFPQYLYDLVIRLKQIQIESLDFKKCIEKYDSKETLFYLDPPYYGCEHYYEGNFNEQDHINLANVLKNIEGKFLLSYYEFDKIEELYPKSDFVYKYKETTKHLEKCIKGNKKSKSLEILIKNF